MPGELEASHPAIVARIAAILSRIVDGRVAPRAGLRELVDVWLSAPHLDHLRYVGEEYDIAQLYGYYWDYDDLEEWPHEVSFAGLHGRAAIAALDADVIRLASEWLRERPDVPRSGR